MPSPRRAFPLYGLLAGFLALLFLLLLWPAVRTAVPETDAWWMIPTFSHYIEGKGPLELFRFILSHSPKYFRPPVLKAFIWVIDDLFQLPFRFFPAAGAGMHLLNAGLLALLCLRLKLSKRVAAACGLIFLTLFLHFHAYLWLPASQHPYSITTLLALLCLFLATEQRVRESRPWRGMYALTALAVLLGSLQHSGFIALPVMLCCAWAAPGLTVPERGGLCLRWLPVWILFLVYPLWAMAFFGDNTAISAVAGIPVPPGMKFAVLMGMGTVLLLLFRRALGVRFLRSRGFWFSIALSGWFLFALWDSRQALLPYNGLVPLMTALGSFLDPFHAALQMDSADPYYYVPSAISVPVLLAVLFLGAVFLLGFVKRKRTLAIWGIWYLVVLFYLLIHKHVVSSMPFRTQSRYFLYVTPVFSVLFACGLVYGLTVLARRIGWGRPGRDRLLAGVLLALCVPNLFAIPLGLFRGRMVNTYFVYDDVRAASLIAADLRRRGGSAPVIVQNPAPLGFRKKWTQRVDSEKIQFENLRRILRDRIGRRRPLELQRDLTDGGLSGGALVYRLKDGQVFDPEGRPLDLFREEVRQGLALLEQGREGEARERLGAAAQRRPFLVNYVMGPGGRLSDEEWVTGGMDLRDWLEWMGRRYRRWSIAPAVKWAAVSSLIRSELSDYMICLSALSILEERAGRPEKGKFRMSQICFIERDPEQAARFLLEDPRVAAGGPLREAVGRFSDPAWFSNPVPWRKNDYAFGRFLARSLFGLDLRSGWERRAEGGG